MDGIMDGHNVDVDVDMVKSFNFALNYQPDSGS